ncbi:hypothetical protein HRbin36_02109 [bacterium HR36]|nr:hypothetical protein HRbin36_02109 [bacterium HR36]
MLRAILVGLDGSPYSRTAMQLASRWARRFGAEVLAVGVVDEPTIRRPEPVPLGAGYFKQHLEETRLREAAERVHLFLQECQQFCASQQITCRNIVDVGDPWEQIVLESQRCDVIVLGQETHFRFETQEEPCDTLFRVLRNAPRPVVTVPKKLPEAETVLVAYDGSVQAGRAMQLFALLGLGQERSVLVCSVHNDAKQARRWAETAGDFLAHHGLQPSLHPIGSSASPAEVLLQEADQHQVGLIVAGAYGKPFLREFFLGSVTQRLLREANVPLFLHH